MFTLLLNLQIISTKLEELSIGVMIHDTASCGLNNNTFDVMEIWQSVSPAASYRSHIHNGGRQSS